ncbi:hypothetical protein M3629_08960 [Paenibacillus polysaccharolyticus]|uniref:hypothetical protein n=1 Tax=Paenibacillus polysaccharolyticus TaxID=582692 RepID=UPI00203D4F96|nr:hypothetical protein [Paenibacillus polysaccharolyticus]MCM3132914.1 hypothetical protein [Paenibacillus polysaccharolyticus]
MANGVFKDGDGSVNSPYLIEDAYDLFEFCSKSNTLYNTKSAKLANDIDLNVAPYNTGTGFALGHTVAFNGVFDGDGYVIRNYFNRQNTAYSGLFPQLGTGTIKNFGMENININNSSQGYQSAVCGAMNNAAALIENVYVRGGSLTGSSYSGAICGMLSNGTIRNVYVLNVTFAMYGNYFGAVVGSSANASAVMYNVWASNTITNVFNASYCGGVSGNMQSGDATKQFNLYYSNRMNYAGYVSLATVMTEVTIKDPAFMYNLNSSQPDITYTRWVLQPSTYPMLWFEDFRMFLLLDAGRPISNIDFGAVLEGGMSPVKKIRLKNGYMYKITEMSFAWTRADGVSDLTELQFSLDGSFTDNSNPLELKGLNILRGREFDLYVRVKTYDGVTGAGQFNITATVTSAE